MKYWLLKSEPSCYSIDDLKKEKRTSWDGVRNYQARNFMRDDMKKGDVALFYHSGTNPPAVVGVAKIVKEAYGDDTALDKKGDHFDPKHTKENSLWVMVDISFVQKFKNPVSLGVIKNNPKLEGIAVAEKGSRLSIQPVSEGHFKEIERMGRG